MHRTLTIAVLALTFGSTVLFATDKPARTAADVLGGDAVVKTMRTADRVVVYRLKDQTTRDKPEDYAAKTGPLQVEAQLARQLAAVVTKYETYDREVAPACEPVFGMRTTFSAGDSTVDVVYCYACNLLTVYHNGKVVGDGYFAPGRKELVALAQKLLPEDKDIQALKE